MTARVTSAILPAWKGHEIGGRGRVRHQLAQYLVLEAVEQRRCTVAGMREINVDLPTFGYPTYS